MTSACDVPAASRRIPILPVFFATVLVVAGASAVALLAFPGSSARYFSWDLGPTPVAALIGGLYLGSLPVFAWALHRDRGHVVALTLGVLGLAVPTLIMTAAHHAVFDWTRWQAVGWVVLFCTAPATVALELRGGAGVARGGPPASPVARSVAATIAVACAVLAVAVWVDPVAVAGDGPVPLAGLAGRYVGAWCSFAAVVAGVTAIRGRRADAEVLSIAVTGLSAGALLAALRTVGALAGRGPWWIAGLATVVVAGLVAVRRSGAATRARRGRSAAQPVA